MTDREWGDSAGLLVALAVFWLLAPITVTLMLFIWLAGIEDYHGNRLHLRAFEVNALIGMLLTWIGVYILLGGGLPPLPGGDSLIWAFIVAPFEIFLGTLRASVDALLAVPGGPIALAFVAALASFGNAYRLARGG